jgi:uncharacterized protein YebE (UPF0316 family)
MILICIKIFLARILDVSLGTIRTVLVVHSSRLKGAILAFFEVLIWFLVAREALNTNVDSIWIPIFYAGGYAAGTYIGTILANNLVDGLITISIITKKNYTKVMLDKIRKEGYKASVINLQNPIDDIKKDMILVQINKKKMKVITKIVRTVDEKSFVMINETKYAQNGIKNKA